MPLFSSLRSRSSSDEKDHDSDDESNNVELATSPSSSRQRTPLLLDPASDNADNGDNFSLRIKLNDGKATNDLTVDSVSINWSVRKLKERILSRHFPDDGGGATDVNASGADDAANSLQSPPRRIGTGTAGGAGASAANNKERYLRLIVRGRMMAPDASRLETFGIAADDVVHAVLAKEGTRGGQQARMLRRMNHQGRGNNSSSGGSASLRASEQTLWRRIGIDANGVVLPSDENDESDDGLSSSEGSEFEDAHGEIDLELGNPRGVGEGGTTQRRRDAGGRRRRRRRERRGFDRLRTTGMTRDEVTAIRLYFARSVDRYIERRRVMIRASRRLRESLHDIVNGGAGGGAGSSRQRSDTGESTNSLLEAESGDGENNRANDAEEDGENGVEGGNNTNQEVGSGANNSNGSSGGAVNNNARSTSNESAFEGEEILLDRLRMEDEWMSTQGPYSEFRMNLNTSNPLLLAAITGNGGVGGAAGMPDTPAGLFFRSRGAALGGEEGGDEDDDDEMFGGAFSPNGTFLRNPAPGGGPGGGPGGFHPYMGPLPSAGTDKDFVWGFVLGFFVGFIMLFWVWMPTVPHKQKIGIMSGISFQLGLNLLRKGGAGGPGAVTI